MSCTVTLSIEGSSLRFLSLSKGRVDRWDSLSLPPGLMRGGFVNDPAGLGQIIRQTLAERNLTRGHAICAFPGLGAVSQVLSVPGLKGRKLKEMVEREVKRLLGISLEGSYLAWQELPGGVSRRRVYVLAVPEEPLFGLASALRLAKVKPRALELKPLALARAVGAKDCIIVNGERTSIGLMVVVDSIPGMMRDVFLGDETMDADAAVHQLLRELPATIDYYNDTHRDCPLGPNVPIYISGELGLDPDLAAKVAAVTGRIVAPIEAPLPCSPDLPLPQYLVNIGLALRWR